MQDFLKSFLTPEVVQAIGGIIGLFITLVVAPALGRLLGAQAQTRLCAILDGILHQALKHAVDTLTNADAKTTLKDVLTGIVSDPGIKANAVGLATDYVKSGAPVILARLGVNDAQLQAMLASRISGVLSTLAGDATKIEEVVGRS